MSDIWGQDIQLGDDGQAVVAANGELVLTDGTGTGVQDIRLRLLTPLGELFYDTEFGSLLHEWIKEESTALTRMGFEQEVVKRLEMDPRVDIGTVACRIMAWDETGITAECSWTFIAETHPENLVLTYDASKKELVVKDANPRNDTDL
jgi:phage baseplate assembly protein W